MDARHFNDVWVHASYYPWISVNERLPNIGEYVYVIVKDFRGQSIMLGNLMPDYSWSLNDFQWFPAGSDNITHWMPMPKG
jgi:hypothetical protein